MSCQEQDSQTQTCISIPASWASEASPEPGGPACMPAPGPNPKAEAGLDAADGGDICLNTYVPRLLRSPACMCTPLLSYMKTIYCGADWAQRLRTQRFKSPHCQLSQVKEPLKALGRLLKLPDQVLQVLQCSKGCFGAVLFYH